VAGALTERDFVAKLDKAGFTEINVVVRQPVGIDQLALYPLFTPDLLDLMRRVIPTDRQDHIGIAAIITACRPRPGRERL
jgi:arsenite methyltransferase